MPLIKKKAPAPASKGEEIVKEEVGLARGWVDGQTIPSVHGKLLTIWPPKTFTGKNGEFTIQNGTIETPEGVIKIALFDSELTEDEKGQEVLFCSTKGKHGLNGVTYEIGKPYTNKAGDTIIEEQLKCSAVCKITVGSKEQEQFEEELETKDSKGADKPKPATRTAPKALAGKPTHVTKDDGEVETREDVLRKILELHMECDALVRDAYPDATPETIQAYTASLFIESNKVGVMRYPTSAPAKQSKRATEAPEPEEEASGDEVESPMDEPLAWQDVVVPSGGFKGKKLGDLEEEDVHRLNRWADKEGYKTEFQRYCKEASEELDSIPM